MEDHTLPGGIARYEKSTGILLNSTFLFYDGAYNYTFSFIDTNADIKIYTSRFPEDFQLPLTIAGLSGGAVIGTVITIVILKRKKLRRE